MHFKCHHIQDASEVAFAGSAVQCTNFPYYCTRKAYFTRLVYESSFSNLLRLLDDLLLGHTHPRHNAYPVCRRLCPIAREVLYYTLVLHSAIALGFLRFLFNFPPWRRRSKFSDPKAGPLSQLSHHFPKSRILVAHGAAVPGTTPQGVIPPLLKHFVLYACEITR